MKIGQHKSYKNLFEYETDEQLIELLSEQNQEEINRLALLKLKELTRHAKRNETVRRKLELLDNLQKGEK